MPNSIRLDSLLAPGDPAVRVMRAHHTNCGRHDHDFYELVYVSEGFCLQDSAGSVILLIEGDIFVIKPGVSHKYIGNRVTHIFNCIFERQAVGEAMAELRMLPGLDRLFDPDPAAGLPRLHLTLAERKGCLRLITMMNDECERRDIGWRARLKSLLVCLLVEFSRAYRAHVGSANEGGAYSAYVSQALAQIDSDYADAQLTVGAIAASVGVSSDYLSRQFRQVTGIAVQEYLRRYRFARAMELLQTGLSVGDVAAQVGFGSLCHFSREFKREMGITPSQYKTQNE